MREGVFVRVAFATVLSAFAVGATECEDEYLCEDSCRILADCEDEWLVADGEEPMTDAARGAFFNDCLDDCDEGSSQNICIGQASCDELSDGECTDDHIF